MVQQTDPRWAEAGTAAALLVESSSLRQDPRSMKARVYGPCDAWGKRSMREP